MTGNVLATSAAILALGASVLGVSCGENPEKAGGSVCQLGGITVPAFATPSLTPEQFRALHAAVAPRGEGERWTEIPWQSDLLSARQRAAREGKPLLMWVMDGHPLGCT